MTFSDINTTVNLLCFVWTTKLERGHTASLINRLSLAAHCHMGHGWACYPFWQSASHLCPSLDNRPSAAAQWGHSSESPVRHRFTSLLMDRVPFWKDMKGLYVQWHYNKTDGTCFWLSIQLYICTSEPFPKPVSDLKEHSVEGNLATDADEANYKSHSASLTVMLCTH